MSSGFLGQAKRTRTAFTMVFMIFLFKIHPVRPSGALLLVARPQVERPYGGRARRGSGCVPYGQEPRGRGVGPYFPNEPQFSSCGDLSPSGPGMASVFPNTFMGRCRSTSIILSILTLVLCHLPTPCLSFDKDAGLKNTWLMDSYCSRHMTGSDK
jgi:hypothetical protein